MTERIISFFERKNMIDYLEENLIGKPIYALNPEDLAVSEEANSDKATTAVANANNELEIDLEEKQNTEAYKETMNIDIENINTIEERYKHYTKKGGNL